jgi:hypothetical protein
MITWPSALIHRGCRIERCVMHNCKPEIERVFEDNLSVYGVRKVWHQMRREGFDIARCTVARLMKDIGIEGVIRGKKPGRQSLTRRSLARWTR